MANYVSMTRSNYFRVQNIEMFRAWITSFDSDIRVIEKAAPNSIEQLGRNDQRDSTVYYAFYFDDGEGLPQHRYEVDAKGDTIETEVDFPAELAKHLQEGEIAVVMESGHEKARYVTGWAFAVKSTGERVNVDLGDIYDKAKEAFGKLPTQAMY